MTARTNLCWHALHHRFDRQEQPMAPRTPAHGLTDRNLANLETIASRSNLWWHAPHHRFDRQDQPMAPRTPTHGLTDRNLANREHIKPWLNKGSAARSNPRWHALHHRFDRQDQPMVPRTPAHGLTDRNLANREHIEPWLSWLTYTPAKVWQPGATYAGMHYTVGLTDRINLCCHALQHTV